MNLLHKPAAVTVAALALAVLPSTAEAHNGSHPFKNCTAAYDAGYSNIESGDEHYGRHLDRDGDGIGCDQPPSDFVPAEDNNASDNGKADEAKDSAAGTKNSAAQQDDTLAKTGGNDATQYLAGAGAAVLLAGGGLLLALRRRRATP
ncbi:excalibur calcium-binding domain-containing protein [Streptomyces sp. NPDC004647]|uniref:excalibur calcium-binding domain-containing protein n=1 Tax=Streptomyces sp. NPDC004647 TaxID=3154671 RepID=UPI0033AD4FE1